MAGNAIDDHLALMARSGMMTHVADLTPPATPEVMARFRSDAAREASNVMALSPGRFALCLGAGRTSLSTQVPHTLTPLAVDTPAPDRTQGAGPSPRRILPPSLRRTPAQSALMPAEAQATPPSVEHHRAQATPPSAPAGLAEDPAHRDELARLVEDIHAAHAQAAAERDAQANLLMQLSARIEGIASDVAHRQDAVEDAVLRHGETQIRRVADSLDAEGGRRRTELEALEARLTDTLTSAHGQQTDTLQRLNEESRRLAIGLAEIEARITDGFATMRLGLRALNDRLADAAADAPDRSPGRGSALPPRDHETRATVTPLHPVPEDAPELHLRAALETLLGRLAPSPAPAGPDRESPHADPRHGATGRSDAHR